MVTVVHATQMSLLTRPAEDVSWHQDSLVRTFFFFFFLVHCRYITMRPWLLGVDWFWKIHTCSPVLHLSVTDGFWCTTSRLTPPLVMLLGKFLNLYPLLDSLLKTAAIFQQQPLYSWPSVANHQTNMWRRKSLKHNLLLILGRGKPRCYEYHHVLNMLYICHLVSTSDIFPDCFRQQMDDTDSIKSLREVKKYIHFSLWGCSFIAANIVSHSH